MTLSPSRIGSQPKRAMSALHERPDRALALVGDGRQRAGVEHELLVLGPDQPVGLRLLALRDPGDQDPRASARAGLARHLRRVDMSGPRPFRLGGKRLQIWGFMASPVRGDKCRQPGCAAGRHQLPPTRNLVTLPAYDLCRAGTMGGQRNHKKRHFGRDDPPPSRRLWPHAPVGMCASKSSRSTPRSSTATL